MLLVFIIGWILGSVVFYTLLVKTAEEKRDLFIDYYEFERDDNSEEKAMAA